MKVKAKCAYAFVVNPEVSDAVVKYFIPNKNFTSLQKAANFVRRHMGMKNAAVIDYENHIIDYDITDEMIKKCVEGENNV